MTTFQLSWTETTHHVAFVQADSESAARQAWIDHEGLLGEFTWPDGSHLYDVTEMPGRHDRLCCCPDCEASLHG